MKFPKPSRWSTQPPDNSPLADEFDTLSALRTIGGTNNVVDANPKVFWRYAGSVSTAPKLRRPEGVVDQFHPAAGANGMYRVTQVPSLMGDSEDFSVVAWVYGLAAAAGNNLHFGRGGASDSVRVYYNSATQLRFAWIDSTPTQSNIDLTVPTYVQFQTTKVGITKKGTTRSVYVIGSDGLRYSATQTAGTATARSSSDTGWYFGYPTTSGGASHQGLIHWSLHRGALPDHVMFDLVRNPWQLFESRRILVPVAAAAGGTFKAAWAMRKARTIGAGAI